MIALDTNVIVRVLTKDDARQLARARALMTEGQLWLSKSVLLEAEWVLRFTYEFDANAINQALSKLVALENLTVEDIGAVLKALGWHKAGMDFADALHVASSGDAKRFATFDKGLVKASMLAKVGIEVTEV